MAEPTTIVFKHTEVVTALLKAQNIHQGIWGLHVRFGIGAVNMGGGPADLNPCAIVPVLEIGLQKFDAESNLAVDAARVNPLGALKAKRRRIKVL